MHAIFVRDVIIVVNAWWCMVMYGGGGDEEDDALVSKGDTHLSVLYNDDAVLLCLFSSFHIAYNICSSHTHSDSTTHTAMPLQCHIA